ncbi:MAG: hypothetical protein M0006_03330 [Magnetospirillum sp.]|nr:hypothetical protein [Magnetospirillum sp.]
MTSVDLAGSNEVILRLKAMGGEVQRSIARVVGEETVSLHSDIRDRIGAGEFFKDPNDRVRNALWSRVEADPTSITGFVGAKPVVLPSGFNLTAGLEHGTAPHDIVAVKVKALAFMLGGALVFRRRVRHPGTSPYRFVTGPFEERRERIRARIEAAADPVIQGGTTA